jgi:MFS family permease
VMAFGMFGTVFLSAQFLQTVQGYSPLEAGVRTLPWTGMPAVTALIAGLLSNRIGARRVVAAGLALQTIAVAWLALIASPTLPYSHLVPPFVIAGTGMGLFFAPIARMVIDFAPPALQGVASGTSNGLRQLGTVLGVAVLGAVFSAVGGYASGQSYVHGLRAAEFVGAAVLAVGVVLALLIPAHTRPGGPEVASTEAEQEAAKEAAAKEGAAVASAGRAAPASLAS